MQFRESRGGCIPENDISKWLMHNSFLIRILYSGNVIEVDLKKYDLNKRHQRLCCGSRGQKLILLCIFYFYEIIMVSLIFM